MNDEEEVKPTSEESIVSEIIANPLIDVTPENQLVLMELWRGKVLEEINDFEDKKAEVYAVYKRQKDMYDKWLSGPLGKMKKLDKIVSGRKKVLIDIDKQILKIKESQIPIKNELNQ